MSNSIPLREVFERAVSLVISDSSEEAFFAGENDLLFAKRMFISGHEFYEDNLERLGLGGLGLVIDAGCGYGQWSVALAKKNRRTLAIDDSPNRIRFLDSLANLSQINNLDVELSSVTKIPVPDGSVDAVFSYGVVFCTPWKETLLEFARTLRPGGLLVFNATSLDWFSYLWKTRHNECSDYRPRKVVAEAFVNSLKYELGETDWLGQVVMDPQEVVEFLHQIGFAEVQQGWEGSLESRHAILNDEQAEDPVSSISARGIFEVRAKKSN
jgi:ubiquinone/menaquinone biosynthesis C-methylase UbiE